MEEPAVQQEKIEGSWEGGHDGGKGDWKNERSLSSLLKHSCLLCWSSPRDTDEMEMDERALAKAAEIRELENAVAVENLELQEQQSDRRELEETLVKLETHKDKLVQQLKATRQLCYEESQQAQEVQKESQVEEYERELARARWRLRRLREQVKEAKRKVEEAGERNTPLQDSIRQSYEEILQEEQRLCSLSGSAVTPESQLEESASPADTTDDDPLPLRPWGRSQSLPAYADLIMGACGSSFYSNLADKREGADDSGTSSTKMDKSDTEDDAEEERSNHEEDREKEECIITPNTISQLDFYQADPFASCQSDHDLFNEDLFPKTETSDGFASDPFKGSDPFAADVLIPEATFDTLTGNPGDEADTSLSCAENKASTGTQCFESEFPDEDSDIEISYSREDLDTVGMVDDLCGFKPIQSSSEQLLPEPIHGWSSQGQYSVESDPNGYDLDIGAISPPSDIEELSLGSLANDTTNTAQAALEQGLGSYSAQMVSEQVLLEPDWTGDVEQSLLSCDITSSQEVVRSSKIEEVTHALGATQNSVDFQKLFIHSDIDQNRELNFDLSYDPDSQSSFDPYGFKLSPEHSSQQLLDPDEAELSSEPTEKDLTYDLKPSSSQPDQLVLDTYRFHSTSSQMVRDCDPYGFRLSPDEENQELLNICGYDNQETLDICTCVNNQTESTTYCSEEELETYTHENHEVLELCSHNSQGDLGNNGNQEVLDSSGFANREIVGQQEVLDHCSPVNQEVVEPFHNTSNQEVLELCNYGNQEVLETDSHGNKELMDFVRIGNQEVLNSGSYNNQELLQLSSNENPESILLSIDSHDNQEVLEFLNKEVVPEANNNQCFVEPELKPTYSSSDSDVATEDLLGLELRNTSKNRNTNDDESPHLSPNHDLTTSNALTRPCMLEGDLSSVFEARGYIGCPDVADDLELQDIREANPVAEPLPPIRPIRPPRPSLKAKEKPQTQNIDLK